MPPIATNHHQQPTRNTYYSNAMHLRSSARIVDTLTRGLSQSGVGDVSDNFLIFFGCVLGTILLLQLALAAVVFKYRESSNLKLHQPHVLLAYVIIAAFATGSCILLVPFNDISCMLQDFFLMLPITFMGNILVARSWRVNILMTPALGIGRDDETSGAKRRRAIKQRVLNCLTAIVTMKLSLKRRVGSEGRGGGRRSSISTKRNSLRQEVTLRQLVFLTVALSMPQLVVQMCKLCIPSLRSELAEDDMYSYCEESRGGQAMQRLGYALSIIPLFILMLLSMYSGGLPLLKMYARSVQIAALFVLIVAFISIPAIAFAMSVETMVYLQSCIILTFTAGTCWLVVVQKLVPVWKEKKREVSMFQVTKKGRTRGHGAQGEAMFSH